MAQAVTMHSGRAASAHADPYGGAFKDLTLQIELNQPKHSIGQIIHVRGKRTPAAAAQAMPAKTDIDTGALDDFLQKFGLEMALPVSAITARWCSSWHFHFSRVYYKGALMLHPPQASLSLFRSGTFYFFILTQCGIH